MLKLLLSLGPHTLLSWILQQHIHTSLIPCVVPWPWKKALGTCDTLADYNTLLLSLLPQGSGRWACRMLHGTSPRPPLLTWPTSHWKLHSPARQKQEHVCISDEKSSVGPRCAYLLATRWCLSTSHQLGKKTRWNS